MRFLQIDKQGVASVFQVDLTWHQVLRVVEFVSEAARILFVWLLWTPGQGHGHELPRGATDQILTLIIPA